MRFPENRGLVGRGEEVLITKHSTSMVRITRPLAVTSEEMPPHPDYEARLKRIWGDRVFTQEEVDEMRPFETGEP
jgi:hypothetical protein